MVPYSTTFPPQSPPDPDDPISVAATDQAAFAGLTEMLSHWDRPHRPSLHWMLTLDGQPELAAAAGRCRSYLPSTGTDAIPPERLHLTVRRLADVDDVSEDHQAAAIEQATDACRRIPPFVLQVLPLAGSPGAIRFSVAPWTPLLRLYRAAATTAGCPDEDPLEVFRPHIGIAYSNQSQPAASFQRAVAQARSESPVLITIRQLSLVSLQRGEHGYTWQTLARIPLGPRPDTHP